MCPACLLLPSQGCRHGAGGTEPIYLKFTLAPRDLHLTFWMSLGQVLREGTTGQLVTFERSSFSHQVQMHCAFFGKGQATAALACPIQVQVYSSGPQGGLLPNMHPEPMVHQSTAFHCVPTTFTANRQGHCGFRVRPSYHQLQATSSRKTGCQARGTPGHLPSSPPVPERPLLSKTCTGQLLPWPSPVQPSLLHFIKGSVFPC